MKTFLIFYFRINGAAAENVSFYDPNKQSKHKTPHTKFSAKNESAKSTTISATTAVHQASC